MNITYSIVNISSSTGFISESGFSLFVVLISVYYSDEVLSIVISAASDYRGKRQVISSITLLYAVIWPSGKFKETYIQHDYVAFFFQIHVIV